MAKVLEHSRVVIVGSECPDMVAACKMIPAETMDEALELASATLGISCQVLVVPHAMLTLPVVSLDNTGGHKQHSGYSNLGDQVIATPRKTTGAG